MIDKTTLGVTAEPEEVEAVLHNLCGYHLTEPDPLTRYTVLTREQVLYDALVASIKRERGRALADLAAAGHTLTQIAHSTNLGTRQRVQRLIAMARAAEEAAAAVQAASRDFHERLAAVEATLDEVVSGISPVSPPVGDPGPADQFDLPAPRAQLDDRLPDLTYADADHVNAVDPAPFDADSMLEPTRAMPALRPLMHPTKEMPPQEEESVPWWRRRSGTTGAA
jgi:hypothetical protein